MHDFKHFFSIFIIIFFFQSNGIAQTQIKKQFFFKVSFPPEIEQSNITCFYQDKNGMMWIGSQDGLLKWDGRVAKTFNNNKQELENLPGNHIFKIEADPKSKDHIWVLSSGGLSQISIITGEVIKSLSTKTKYNNEEFETSTQFHAISNDFWLGTYRGLRIFNQNKFEINYPKWLPYDYNTETQNNFIDLIYHEGEDVWVFFRKYGLVIYNATTYDTIQTVPLSKFAFEGNYLFQRFVGLFKEKNIYILTTDEKIIQIDWNNNAEQKISIKILSQAKEIRPISYAALTHPGTLVLGGLQGLYEYSFSNKVFSSLEDWTFSSKMDLSLNNFVVYPDKNNNLWIGNSKGVSIYSKKLQFSQNHFMTGEKDKKLSRIYHIFPYSSDTTWISDYSGYYLVNNNSGSISQFFSDGPYFFSDTLGFGLRLVSNINGTFLHTRMQKQKISTVFPELQLIEKEVLNSMVRIAGNRYLIASELGNGVYIWDRGIGKVFKLDKDYCGASLENETINGMKLLSDGRVMILCEFELAIFNPSQNKLENFSLSMGPNKMNLGVFMDVVELEEEYWFACYGNGLLKCDKKLKPLVLLSGKDGLSNLALYKVLKIDNRFILATSNNGLFKLDTKECKLVEWSSSQGIQTHRFEEGAGEAAFDKMYVGGFDGLSIIDPKKMPDTEDHPLIFFDAIFYKSKSGAIIKNDPALMAAIKIKPDIEQVDIHLNVVDFFPHLKDTLQYKLLPAQETWQSGAVLNKLSFIGLQSGSYTLQCRVKKQQSEWSPLATLSFRVLPPWYQTTWFYLLCILAAAAISYALYRYRLAQIHKEYRFKEKISADLHDDLGSTITGIKMFTELGVATGSPKYYAPVKQGLTDAALAIREMIWVLDNNTNTAAEILKKLAQNSSALLSEKGIAFVLNYDAALERMPLKTDEKRDLYLLLKEFVNNSVKYSECSRISLYGAVKGKQKQLTISDNGKGFDLTKVKRGNGIFNIETRAKRCNYSVSWKTGLGQGTTLLLTRGKR